MPEKKNPNVTMKASKFRSTMREVAGMAYNTAIVIFFLSVRDEFSFGGQRLTRLLDRVNRTAKQVEDGEVTFDDIIDALKDEGIDFGFESDEGKCKYDPRYCKGINRGFKI